MTGWQVIAAYTTQWTARWWLPAAALTLTCPLARWLYRQARHQRDTRLEQLIRGALQDELLAHEVEAELQQILREQQL
jgi:hypothetical protein